MRLLAVLTTALLLSACAMVPPETASLPAGAAPIPARLLYWQFNGRVSLVRADEGWHAALEWREKDGNYRLQVSSPLGQGVFQLTGNNEAVMLTGAGEQPLYAMDVDRLMADATGWELPVAGMRYWVLGRPDPAYEFTETRDPAGRLQTLEQAGWQIGYTGYEAIDGLSWPKKMRLQRDDITVKLVIDQWNFALLPDAQP